MKIIYLVLLHATAKVYFHRNLIKACKSRIHVFLFPPFGNKEISGIKGKQTPFGRYDRSFSTTDSFFFVLFSHRERGFPLVRLELIAPIFETICQGNWKERGLTGACFTEKMYITAIMRLCLLSSFSI